MRAAAENITKVSLELGGKAPAIVRQDADLDLAANSIRDSRIINTGQVCNCAERVYVHESVAEKFIDKVTAVMKATRFGDPLDEPDVEMGPLVSKQQLRTWRLRSSGRSRTERESFSAARRRTDPDGFFYPPTVLTHCRQNTDIMQKEIFGPVLPIATFKDLDEALEMANDCEYGLTSSIYTQNLDVVMRACNELRFGETYVNRENFEAMQGFHAGWRKSGIGGADGKHGVEEYLQTHVVYVDYNQQKK